MPATPDAAGSSADAAVVSIDAPIGPECPDAMFRAFALPVLESHSNVCVNSATCTFTRVEGCHAHFSCDYYGAGVQTGDVTFAHRGAALAATFDTGTRHHEWVYDGGMAYRITGSLDDHSICVFTDGATSPVFSAPAGQCPDLMRTYLLREATAHICSHTLRCGVFQSGSDPCVVDAFCTYPTGTTRDFHAVTIAPRGSSGTIVGDATRDPMYPEHYDIRLSGDFTGGTGAATDVETDYFFNSSMVTCSWIPNGSF